jgi:hypothetical protein
MLRLILGAAALASASAGALNATIINGVLQSSPPQALGSFTSALNSWAAAFFSSATPDPASSAVLLNSSSGTLSYLTLTGPYAVDEPLLLFPQLILVLLNAQLTAAANLSSSAQALILANHSAFAGVVAPGGPSTAELSCPAGGPAGVLALQSPSFLLDGLAISGCGSAEGGAVHIKGEPYTSGAEVSNCLITWSGQRAIWTETVSRVLIFGNTVSQTYSHSIDFDAFSSDSVAFNNTVLNSRQEGIFIEQGASYITVSSNTLGPNNSVGVAVYNNDIKALCGPHLIVGNTISGNRDRGISVGSTSPKSGAPDSQVTILGNTLSSNGGAVPEDLHTNGGQIGTVYAGNSAPGGVAPFTISSKFSNSNISMFDPLDRVIISQGS